MLGCWQGAALPVIRRGSCVEAPGSNAGRQRVDGPCVVAILRHADSTMPPAAMSGGIVGIAR